MIWISFAHIMKEIWDVFKVHRKNSLSVIPFRLMNIHQTQLKSNEMPNSTCCLVKFQIPTPFFNNRNPSQNLPFPHLADSPPLATLREPAKPIRGEEPGLGLLNGVFSATFVYHFVMGESAVDGGFKWKIINAVLNRKNGGWGYPGRFFWG